MDSNSGAKVRMRLASIDIGTNTVLLLIADIDSNGIIHPLAFEQRLPRIGKDVDGSGNIRPSAFERVENILREYKEIVVSFQVVKIIACGTSAVRDAVNRMDFISHLHSKTGITIEILTGEEEALWTYKGAISGLPDLNAKEKQEITASGKSHIAVIDIGGGSTEISYPNPGTHNGNLKLNRYSLQLGSVRLTERFFKHNPPLPAEIQSATEMILEECAQVKNPGFHQHQLIGVAGTATTLACLDQGLMEFDRDKISGYVIDKDQVLRWQMKLQSITTEEIRKLSNTTEGRADILTAGVLILSECMKLFGFSSVQVSERGLRYGLMLREWKQSKPGS